MGKFLDDEGLRHYTGFVTGMADNKTLEYTQASGESRKTLKVKDGGITKDKLAAALQPSVPDSIGASGTILKSDGASAGWSEQTMDLVTLWIGTAGYEGTFSAPGILDYSAVVMTVTFGSQTSRLVGLRNGNNVITGATGVYNESESKISVCAARLYVSSGTNVKYSCMVWTGSTYSTSAKLTKIEGWLK